MWNKLSQAAGFSAVEPTNDPSDDRSFVSEEEDQLQQHQLTIEQLKNLVRENEKLLQEKEKQLEDLSSKFQKFKLQSKAKISHLSNQIKEHEKTSKKEDCDFDDTSSSDSSDQIRRGQVLFFKKQIEHLKQQLDRKEEECFKLTKAYEQKFNDLEAQLNEKNILISSFADKKSAEIVEEKPAEKSPKKESSNQELYAQIVYKDAKILEMNNQVLELEKKIMDLQEHIKEKDEVLQQRNRAVQLMAEDMSRKGQTVVSELDETRDQMKLMQENFATLESEWKKELERQKSQIEELSSGIFERDKKQKNSEAVIKSLESARYELATKNAELQKKLVLVQEGAAKQCELYNQEMEGELEVIKKSLESEKLHSAELQKALDEFNMQSENKVLKARVKERTKLKALEREYETAKKINEGKLKEILEFQQRIAELEEDKGSLQLKLMEYDEQISQLDKLSEENEMLQGRIKELCDERQNCLKQINELQTDRDNWKQKCQASNENFNQLQESFICMNEEKSKLQAKISDMNLEKQQVEKDYGHLKQQHINLENEFNEAAQQLRLLKDQKVAFELKHIELEEMRENDEKGRREFEAKIKELEHVRDDERKLKEELECEISKLRLRLDNVRNNSSSHEEQVKELFLKIDNLQNMLNRTELEKEEYLSFIEKKDKLLHSQENNVQNFILTVDQLKSELEKSTSTLISKEQYIESLKKSIFDKDNYISQLRSELNEKTAAEQNFIEMVQKLNEQLIKSQEKEKESSEKLESYENAIRIEHEKFHSEITPLHDKITTLENKASCLDNELNYKLKENEELQKEIIELRTQNENTVQILQDNANLIKEKEALLEEFELRNHSLDESLSNLMAENNNLINELKKKDEEMSTLAQSNEQYKALILDEQDKSFKLMQKLEENEKTLIMQNDTVSKLNIQNKLLEEENMNCKLLLSEKDEICCKILEEKSHLQIEFEKLKEHNELLEISLKDKTLEIDSLNLKTHDLENVLLKSDKHKKNLQEQLQINHEDIENLRVEYDKLSAELQESKKSNKNLMETNLNLQKNVTELNDTVAGLLEKLRLNQEEMERLKSEYEKMCTQVEESRTIEERHEELTERNLILEKNVIQLKSSLENLQIQFENNLGKIKSLKSEYENKCIELEESKKSHETLLEMNMNLQHKLTEISNAMVELQTQLHAKQDQIKNLEIEHEKQCNALEESKKSNENLIQTNRSIQNKVIEMSNTMKEIGEKEEAQNQSFKDSVLKIEKYHEQSEEFASKIIALEQELKKSSNNEVDLKNQISKLHAEVQQLNEENELLKNNISSLPEKYLEQISNLSQKISSIGDENVIANDKIMLYEKRIAELTEECYTLQDSVRNYECQLQNWKDEMEEKSLEINNLNNFVSDLQQRIDSYENEFIKLHSEKEEAVKNCSSMKSEINNLQNILSEQTISHNTIEELQRKITNFKEEKEKVEYDNNELQSLINEQNKQINNLKCMLEEEKLENQKTEKDYYIVETKLKNLQSIMEDYQLLMKNIAGIYHLPLDASVFESNELVNNVDEFSKNMKNLSDLIVEEVSKSKNDINELQEEISNYKYQLNDYNILKAEHSTLNIQIENMKDYFSKLAQIITDNSKLMNLKYDDMFSSVCNKTKSLDHLKSKFLALHQFISIQSDKINSLETDKITLMKKLEFSENVVSHSEKIIEELNADKVKLTETNIRESENFKEKISQLETALKNSSSVSDSSNKETHILNFADGNVKLATEQYQRESPSNLTTEFASDQKENETLKEEINVYKMKSAKMLTKLKLFKDKNEKLLTEFNAVKVENKKLLSINSSILEQQKDLEDKLILLQDENSRLINQLETAEKQKQVDFNNTNNIICQMRERNSFLEEECGKLRKDLQEYKYTWEQCSISYELQKEDNERLRKRLNELLDEAEISKSKLSEINLHLAQMEKENQLLKQEVQNLREHANMLLSDNDTYQDLIEKLTSTKNTLEQKLSAEKEKNDKEIKQLKQYYQSEYAKDNANQQNIVQEATFANLQNDYASLQETCSKLKLHNDKLQQEFDTFVKNNNLLEKEKIYLQHQLLENVDELDRVKEELNNILKKNNCEISLLQSYANSDLSGKVITEEHEKISELKEENRSLKSKLNYMNQELNLTSKKFEFLQQESSNKEASYKNKMLQLEGQVQELTNYIQNQEKSSKNDFSESKNINTRNLESELQQAMSSLHHQGLRCEELSLEVSQLLEERNNLLWKLQQYQQLTPMNKLEVQNSDNSSSQFSELVSVQVESSSVSPTDFAILQQRLAETEKTCQQLRQANQALDQALMQEREQKKFVEEELGYAKEHLISEAKSSDEYQILMGNVPEPDMFAETHFSISRNVRTHAYRIRRWLRGRRNYLFRAVKSRNYPQLVYIFYIFLIHIWLLTCIFR